jgi:hypothetical protein
MSTTKREMNPSEVDAQSTHATGWVNSAAPNMNLLGTFHSGGGPHAEDKLVEFIETNNIRDAYLCVYLTKSPCTKESRSGLPATGKGCAEMLLKLAVERNLHFQILVRNLYQPAISGSDKSSILAVEELIKSGRFAFSIDKDARSNTGKVLYLKLLNTVQGNLDQDGFYGMKAPANNDLKLDLDLGS